MMKNPVITGKINLHKNKNAEKVKKLSISLLHIYAKRCIIITS